MGKTDKKNPLTYFREQAEKRARNIGNKPMLPKHQSDIKSNKSGQTNSEIFNAVADREVKNDSTDFRKYQKIYESTYDDDSKYKENVEAQNKMAAILKRSGVKKITGQPDYIISDMYFSDEKKKGGSIKSKKKK